MDFHVPYETFIYTQIFFLGHLAGNNSFNGKWRKILRFSTKSNSNFFSNVPEPKKNQPL